MRSLCLPLGTLHRQAVRAEFARLLANQNARDFSMDAKCGRWLAHFHHFALVCPWRRHTLLREFSLLHERERSRMSLILAALQMAMTVQAGARRIVTPSLGVSDQRARTREWLGRECNNVVLPGDVGIKTVSH